MSADAVTAAILAGGAGQRLDGRDKGLELLGGRPLIAYVAERIRAQVSRVMIIANRHADVYATYAPVYADDAPGFRGPLAGIATALTRCETPWLLTAAVDVPEPPRDLAARLAETRGEHEVAVAHDGSRRQPLFALYSRTLAASARDALARDLAVWRWQDECGVIQADFSDARDAFRNLNTPDDFRSWEHSQHG